MGPTIAVMARAPVAGHCKTRLAAWTGADRAAALCRAMLLDTLDAIGRSVDARLVVMAAPEHDGASVLRGLVPPPWEVIVQAGASLGERLAHALVTLHADSSVVALVDADSPTAPWEAAGRTLASLRAPRSACIGPCEDGGYWLIGSTEPETRLFDDIAWSTPTVANETRARCRTIGLSLVELPVAYDIDEHADVVRLRGELDAHPELAPKTRALLERM